MASAIPKTMKGVLIEKTGGVEVLEYKTDLPVPTLKEGQILVKNDFIGINYIDTYASPRALDLFSRPRKRKEGRRINITNLFIVTTALACTLPPNPRSSAATARAPWSLRARASCITSKSAIAWYT
jgi:hypothetical protein